ncbi:MAG: radical SAM family heme chaperone HemW [Lentisphaerae bacterium]|nr:radical SAM family heme chaperone HemW [Lentisphaerota bacterium]
MKNLYIHIPYCDGKCLYCAFYSIRGATAEREAYADLPGLELAHVLAEGVSVAPETVYFGGGTPSALGPDGLRRLAAGLRQRVSFGAVVEWTAEVTPPMASDAVLGALCEMGVNRISMGVQCLDDRTLRALGRRHDAAEAEAAVRRIRAVGLANVGLDLIAGLPGLDEQAWGETLARTLALDPAHVSVYALSVEPGSGLARQVERGLTLPGEAEGLAALQQAEAALTAAGLARYEISNYARPGRACLHNLACWRGEDYLGLGPAAASRIGLTRRTHAADAAAYRAAITSGNHPPTEAETLSPADDATERFIFSLRLAEGGSPQRHAERWPAAGPNVATWERRLDGLARHGITEEAGTGRWRLTVRGREVADAVGRELLW